jgi:hypothetical protein
MTFKANCFDKEYAADGQEKMKRKHKKITI